MLLETASPDLAGHTNEIEEFYKLKVAIRTCEPIGHGDDVIDLSSEGPDFKTPEHICQAAQSVIDEGFYANSPGTDYFDQRTSIVGKLMTQNDIDWEPENIVVSAGGRHLLVKFLLAT